MPRDGSGNFTLTAGNPVVPNTVISSSGWANPTLSDIAAALTQSISRDGQTSPTANLTMGNFRLINLGAATTRTDATNAGQIQDGGLTALGSVSGTDTITASSAPAITVYTAGQCFDFIAAGANATNTVTLNINALGAKAVTKFGANGLNPGDFQTGQSVRVRYDGTEFQVISPILGAVPNINRLINGDFRVSQVNGSTAVTPAATAYPIDQWQALMTQASKLTFQQLAAPSGFVNVSFAEKISVASAFTAGASDNFAFRQPVEGLNVSDFLWGTSSAKPVTIQLQVSASLTGNYSIYFQNYAGTRSYVTTVNVAAANTPQLFTVTIPGDTGGSWAAISNTGFLYFGIDLGSGSSFQGTAGSWGAGNVTRVSGSVALVANAGTSMTVSGFQLETGTVATVLNILPYQQALALCQRYLPVFNSLSSSDAWGIGQVVNGNQAIVYMKFPVQTRVSPNGATAVNPAGALYALTTSSNGNDGSTAISLNSASPHGGSVLVTVTTSALTAGNATQLFALSTSAQIVFTGAQL